MSRWTWAGLNLLLWTLAAAVVAARFALPAGVAAAVAGAAAGVFAGRALAQSALRAYTFPLAALAAAVLAVGAQALMVGSEGLASLLGPGGTYAAAELLPAFILPFAAVAVLEALARRHPAFRAGEIAAVAALYAALFAAHREGFVNRPYFLVDPLWGSGKDPLGYFLLIGLALAVLAAVTLAKGTRGRRSFAGLLVLVLLLGALFFALPQGQLKNVAELHRVLSDKEGGKEGKGGKKPKGGDAKDGARSGEPGRDQTPGGGGASDLPDTFSDLSSGQQDSPVAVVVFHGDYTPPLGYYYFRETAFSSYNGVRLVQDASGRYDRDLAPGFAGALQKLPSAGVPHGTRFIPGVKEPAFLDLRTTVALMAPHARPFGLVNPSELRPAANPDTRRFFRAYEVRSSALELAPMALLPEKAGGAGWGDNTFAHYTEGPADPRYGALAEKILATLPAPYRDRPFARAVAVKLWLDRNGTYSLNSTHGEEGDPVSEFLFGDLTGHCVHFAHAACLLYRAVGVPARVAAGYAVRADFRGGGASLLVRSREAHAWPEICLEETGWVPLDISPAKSTVPPEEAPDPGLQQMLGDMVMQEKPPPEPPPQDRPGASLWDAVKGALAALGLLLLALLALALPAAYAVKLWRRWSPGFCAPGEVPRLAYRAALDTAAATGRRRLWGQPREAFARELAGASPAFAELTARHLRRALGRPGSDPESQACRALLVSARAQLAARTSRPRRFFGALNPVSWWGVR